MPMLMRTVRTGEEDARRDAMIPKPPEEVEM
jgi:hypothetical protein